MAVNINIPSQVKTYANLAAFPATGALKTIYIAEDTNKTYRWTGSVYVEVSASASGITIGTTAIASGVVGRVLFEGAGNVVQESGNLFWDDTNVRLGVGTSTPANKLDIKGTGDVVLIDSNSVASRVTLKLNTTSASYTQIIGNGTEFNLATLGSTHITFGTNSAERVRIGSTTGNILIGTTTDAGFLLDVNGTARVSGNFTLKNVTDELLFANATVKIRRVSDKLSLEGFSGFDFIDTNTAFTRMQIRSTGNVLINTTTDAGFKLDVNGTARVSGNLTLGAEVFGTANTYINGPSANTGNLFVRFASVNIISATKIGTTVYTDTSSGLILGKTGVSSAARGFLASDTNYQDFGFVNTSISSGNINAWTFGQRQDTYFGNALGSFQIVGAYYDNTGAGSMVGGGFRVPLICNPNGDIIISGAANSINGNVSFGSTTVAASALVSITSTTKGFLPPRMTTTQRNAIASPAAGLMVYDTTLNVIMYYNGSMWI